MPNYDTVELFHAKSSEYTDILELLCSGT